MGLILFGFITALMATIGRVDELPEPLVPTRYTPFACLLQIGVGLAAVRRLETLGGARKVAFTGAYVISVLAIAAAPHGVQALGRASAKIKAASDLFDRTGRQEGFQMNPDPALATAVRAELRRRALPY